MAGRGPAPKAPEQRVRRNPPAAGEWVDLPTEPYDGPKPPLPDLETLEAVWTWEQWWSSPMAHMWTRADWPGLLRLICMIDNSGALEVKKEIRLQEERFGLSPKGRQSLRWRIVEEPEVPAREGKRPKRDRRSSSLEVIQGGS